MPDLEKATQFYCDVFELEVIGQFEMDTAKQDWVHNVTGLEDVSGIAAQLKGKNGFIELFQFNRPTLILNDEKPTAAQLGFAHIAFQVSDIHQVYQRLVKAGGSAHGPPSPVGKAIALYCRDPFGNIVELLEFVEEDAKFDLKETGRG